MLDVHPPEHTPHSWRDFFIHIATIVVGLLIAIGLEQTVEWMHHRHQMHVAREHILAETVVNERIVREDMRSNELQIACLKHDLTLLDQRKAGQSPTESLAFGSGGQSLYNAAYINARDSGSTVLMPYNESAMYADAYGQEEITAAALFAVATQNSIAVASIHGRSLQQIAPADVPPIETEVSALLGRAEFFRITLEVEQEELQAVASGHYRNNIGGSFS